MRPLATGCVTLWWVGLIGLAIWGTWLALAGWVIGSVCAVLCLTLAAADPGSFARTLIVLGGGVTR